MVDLSPRREQRHPTSAQKHRAMKEEQPDIKADTFPRYKPSTADYPDYLKDRANYQKIRKLILDAGATPHSHSDMAVWASCRKCQLAAHNRAETMKALGFKTGAHYLAWQKIHETIITRVPLPKHNA